MKRWYGLHSMFHLDASYGSLDRDPKIYEMVYFTNIYVVVGTIRACLLCGYGLAYG